MNRLKIDILLLLLSVVRFCHAQYFSFHLGIEEWSSTDSPGTLTCIDTRDDGSSSFKLVKPCPQTGSWQLELAEVDEQDKSKFLRLIYISVYCLIIISESHHFLYLTIDEEWFKIRKGRACLSLTKNGLVGFDAMCPTKREKNRSQLWSLVGSPTKTNNMLVKSHVGNTCVEMIRDPNNISATAIAVDCLEMKNAYV